LIAFLYAPEPPTFPPPVGVVGVGQVEILFFKAFLLLLKSEKPMHTLNTLTYLKV